MMLMMKIMIISMMAINKIQYIDGGKSDKDGCEFDDNFSGNKIIVSL